MCDFTLQKKVELAEIFSSVIWTVKSGTKTHKDTASQTGVFSTKTEAESLPSGKADVQSSNRSCPYKSKLSILLLHALSPMKSKGR